MSLSKTDYAVARNAIAAAGSDRNSNRIHGIHRWLAGSARSDPLLATVIVMTVILLCGAGVVNGQTTITPEPESRFWIEGASNVNRFDCEAGTFEGEMEIEPELPEELADEIRGEINLELRIPVLSFECGRRRMNRDFYEALKSDSHPYIHFEYLDTRVLEQLEKQAGEEGNHWLLEVEGVLTVAGTSRTIMFNAEGGVLDEKRVRVRGHKPILMTDYDIDPPTALLGVVRAQDELTVYFDIVATIHRGC